MAKFPLEEVDCSCLQRARNVYLRESHAVHARCMTYTVLSRLLLFLRASFFHPQEGANQAVPEALMDMAMKVCGPFHSLSIFLLQQFESFACV